MVPERGDKRKKCLIDFGMARTLLLTEHCQAPKGMQCVACKDEVFSLLGSCDTRATAVANRQELVNRVEGSVPPGIPRNYHRNRTSDEEEPRAKKGRQTLRKTLWEIHIKWCSTRARTHVSYAATMQPATILLLNVVAAPQGHCATPPNVWLCQTTVEGRRRTDPRLTPVNDEARVQSTRLSR